MKKVIKKVFTQDPISKIENNKVIKGMDKFPACSGSFDVNWTPKQEDDILYLGITVTTAEGHKVKGSITLNACTIEDPKKFFKKSGNTWSVNTEGYKFVSDGEEAGFIKV